jgi:hypothetical protein
MSSIRRRRLTRAFRLAVLPILTLGMTIVLAGPLRAEEVAMEADVSAEAEVEFKERVAGSSVQLSGYSNIELKRGVDPSR